jgi:hypothetical protein
MPPMMERVLGIILTLAAIFGLILNVAALIFLPAIEQSAVQTIGNTLFVVDNSLVTTTQALDVATGALDNTQVSMTAIENTTRAVAQTVDDTRPVIQVVSDLTANALPQTISGTRGALQVAANSAAGIDAVLAALGSINILGTDLGLPEYDPDTSLSASLQEVENSLEPLEDSFDDIAISLATADGNLAAVNTQMVGVADSLASFDTTITDAKLVTDQYKTVIVQQQGVLLTLNSQVPLAVTWGIRGVMILLAYLLIAQMGLLSQGVEMIWRSGTRMNKDPHDDAV